MTKLSYTFTTLSPLHTGSDVLAGTLRTLRRQKCILPEPDTFESRLEEKDRSQAMVDILLAVWLSLPWDSIKGTRLKQIWDEFGNKLRAAATMRTKTLFLQKLCDSWGIESIKTYQDKLTERLGLLSDRELLDMARNETIYLCVLLRTRLDEAKAAAQGAEPRTFDFPEIKVLNKPVLVKRYDDEVPCISGNAFRGRLRRLVMHDFCKRVGITKMDKRTYHMLFSGGFLDQSSQYQDFDEIERLTELCPMLRLFGAAIGNTTIEGDLAVGWAYPLCKERGTSDYSYWNYLDIVFQTRHDSSKTEDVIEIVEGQAGGPTEQMMYQYEVFAPGTTFEHQIACTTDNPLIVSAFWHMMRLFLNDMRVGGMLGVGTGRITMDTGIKLGDAAPYLSYLEQNKEKMREAWQSGPVSQT